MAGSSARSTALLSLLSSESFNLSRGRRQSEQVTTVASSELYKCLLGALARGRTWLGTLDRSSDDFGVNTTVLCGGTSKPIGTYRYTNPSSPTLVMSPKTIVKDWAKPRFERWPEPDA